MVFSKNMPDTRELYKVENNVIVQSYLFDEYEKNSVRGTMIKISFVEKVI